MTNYGVIPEDALKIDGDVDGNETYVGRAHHDCHWIPARIVPVKHICYVPYGGQEHVKHLFEVIKYSLNVNVKFKQQIVANLIKSHKYIWALCIIILLTVFVRERLQLG